MGNFALLQALEMELSGGVNFLTFHPDKKRAHTEPDTVKQFNYYPMGIGIFRIQGDINETMGFEVNIERDNVLQNSIKTIFSAKTDYFMLEFGPFVGITDDLNTPDAGIIGSLAVALPGIISLSISGFSTLGTQFEFTSSNFREGFALELQFWLPKMILTASAGIKNLSRSSEDIAGILLRSDALTRYMLSIDFYSKGSPIMTTLEGGYQTYSRTYKRGVGSWEYIDKLQSFFGGLGFQLQAFDSMKLKAGIEIPFLITAEEPMTVTPEFLNLSKFIAGFIYTFNGRP